MSGNTRGSLAAARAARAAAIAFLAIGTCVLIWPELVRAEALTPEQAQARAETRAGAPGPGGPAGRVSVLVHMEPASDRGPVRAFARQHGAKVRYEYKTVMPNVVNLRNLPEAAVEALKRASGVVKVEEDKYHPNLVRLHDSTPLVRGLQSQVAGANLSADGSGARVCVVDTGIDSNHLMYAARIDTAAGHDFANDDSNPEDDHGHGSHVAGIAVGAELLATLNPCPEQPFQGIAPQATLIGVKVLNSSGGGLDSNIIAGIDHCADPELPGGRADVINLSIGTGQFAGDCDGQHSWADAANNAVDAGVVVVAAAGNEAFSNALAAPACGSKVMAVGASYDADFPSCDHPTVSDFTWCLNYFCTSTCTDPDPGVDDLVCFSNQSDDLDVVAPGCAIWSARSDVPSGVAITWKCGTSMSSPHVAGLAALILSVDGTLTPFQVRQVIRSGAIDLGPAGLDRAYGYGRIDVINSLLLAPPLCDGDEVCETGEDCNNCSFDCPSGSGASCGNDICEVGDGEDCLSCPEDCNGKQKGKPSRRFCCGDGDGQGAIGCGDPRCTAEGLSCTDVPATGFCCGDGSCDPGEDECSCPVECGEPPGTESSCTDGVDNDCDGSVDCADGDDCGTDPACDTPPPPPCEPIGTSCTSNGDCCSNKCKGKPGSKTCK